MSFGVAEFVPGEPPAEFVRRADEAMYAAKNGGRNRWGTGKKRSDKAPGHDLASHVTIGCENPVDGRR